MALLGILTAAARRPLAAYNVWLRQLFTSEQLDSDDRRAAERGFLLLGVGIATLDLIYLFWSRR